MTPIERAEAEELRKMEIKIEEMKIRLLELKKKSTQQSKQAESNKYNEKKQEIVFKGDQESTIKNNLGHMYVSLSLIYESVCFRHVIMFLNSILRRSKDIKALIAEVKKLEEEVSI